MAKRAAKKSAAKRELISRAGINVTSAAMRQAVSRRAMTSAAPFRRIAAGKQRRRQSPDKVIAATEARKKTRATR